jgi:casein kinase I family protein HRR25
VDVASTPRLRLGLFLTLGSTLGTVFLGVHTVAGKEVAIKLEPAVTKNSLLKQESKIYKTLMGGTGVPWIMWSGKKGDYNVLVIDLLGPSLEDLFKMCNRRFSLKTVLLIADQLVRQYLFFFFFFFFFFFSGVKG